MMNKYTLELTRSEAQELWDILRDEWRKQIDRAKALRGSSLLDECEIRADFCFRIIRMIDRLDPWTEPTKEDGDDDQVPDDPADG